MIVHFVDIGGIDDHSSLIFLFMTYRFEYSKKKIKDNYTMNKYALSVRITKVIPVHYERFVQLCVFDLYRAETWLMI